MLQFKVDSGWSVWVSDKHLKRSAADLFVVPPVQPKSERDGIGLALPDVLDKNVRQQDTLDEKINGIEIARRLPTVHERVS